eukprot:5340352-Amphidinium_carterae.1
MMNKPNGYKQALECADVLQKCLSRRWSRRQSVATAVYFSTLAACTVGQGSALGHQLLGSVHRSLKKYLQTRDPSDLAHWRVSGRANKHVSLTHL